MELNGRQRQQFQQALLSAFPSKAKLAQMLSFELDWELDAIAGGQNQSEIIFNLINHAEASGQLNPLLTAATSENPGNPTLRDFAQTLTINNTPNPSSPDPPELATDTKTILFLASNPKETGRLRLDKELREISESLRRSNRRDSLILQNQGAVRFRDFYRAILDHNPKIIHFSGHGVDTSSDPDEPEPIQGLLFEGDNGRAKLIPTEQLAAIFQLFSGQVECVLLNACHSKNQAEAIAQHIPYVIGMRQPIKDGTAIAFATAFYDAIGAGRDTTFAFQLACTQLIATQEQDIPELLHSTSP